MRPNSFGEAIKSIKRSFTSKDVRDNNVLAAGGGGGKETSNDDDKARAVPEYIHTDEETNFRLLQCSDLSADIVPSTKIPTMGGTSSSHDYDGTDLNFNVDIRETAKQASADYYFPKNSVRRDRGLFGSFLTNVSINSFD